MELTVGIFLVIIGCVMIIKPKVMWKIADSWKIKTNAGPTNLYMIIIRIGGCILFIGGIFASLEML